LVFDNGTIFTQSHHEDVDYKEHGVVKGLRIDRTFQVAGG
jgi:hypothetical protein